MKYICLNLIARTEVTYNFENVDPETKQFDYTKLVSLNGYRCTYCTMIKKLNIYEKLKELEVSDEVLIFLFPPVDLPNSLQIIIKKKKILSVIQKSYHNL